MTGKSVHLLRAKRDVYPSSPEPAGPKNTHGVTQEANSQAPLPLQSRWWAGLGAWPRPFAVALLPRPPRGVA